MDKFPNLAVAFLFEALFRQHLSPTYSGRIMYQPLVGM